MAKKSLSVQLSELREYTAKLEIELAGYRRMQQERAARSAQSTGKPTGKSTGKPTLQQFCKSYCRENGVHSVPGHVVSHARAQGVIA